MDFKATLMRKFFYWQLWLNEKCSTITALLKFKLWGIVFGKGIRIIGRIIVFRNPNSIIQIGNHCLFNSSSMLNFRGINHPCIIQTGAPFAKIIIGNHVEMSGTSIVSNNFVNIGNHVLIGSNCQIGDRDGHSNRYKSLPNQLS
jgi:acetyltransferase-like isoleucine patch superfamily enzyme